MKRLFKASELLNFDAVKSIETDAAGALPTEPQGNAGFTLIEVITATLIMVVLCVGTLSVFSYVVKLNEGNNLRSQALTVLQAEAELYRSYKYVPNCDATDDALKSGTYIRPPQKSEDGTEFNITVTVKNVPSAVADCDATMKEIKIDAVPKNLRTGWLANLKTDLTIQRVRSN